MRSTILLLLVLSVCLVSCTHKTDVTNDPRFKGITTKQVYAKKRLRLYDNNYQFSEGKGHYKLVAFDEGQENLTTYIPTGHPVKLSRIYRRQNMGGTWEELYGEEKMPGILSAGMIGAAYNANANTYGDQHALKYTIEETVNPLGFHSGHMVDKANDFFQNFWGFLEGRDPAEIDRPHKY